MLPSVVGDHPDRAGMQHDVAPGFTAPGHRDQVAAHRDDRPVVDRLARCHVVVVRHLESLARGNERAPTIGLASDEIEQLGLAACHRRFDERAKQRMRLGRP